MTISGGMFRGFNKESAVKFSFIMSIPAILGANILELKHLGEQQLSGGDIFSIAIGILCSFAFGIVAIKIITWLGKKRDFKVFSYYCFIVGITVIIASLVLK
jgi:undecaprenyl-diphosphatase